jgi:hypothetical protein
MLCPKLPAAGGSSEKAAAGQHLFDINRNYLDRLVLQIRCRERRGPGIDHMDADDAPRLRWPRYVGYREVRQAAVASA